MRVDAKMSSFVKAFDNDEPKNKSGWSDFNENLSGTAGAISNTSYSLASGVETIANATNKVKPTLTTKIGLDTKTLIPILAVLLFIFRKKIF